VFDDQRYDEDQGYLQRTLDSLRKRILKKDPACKDEQLQMKLLATGHIGL
jgi:hypothetical protein